MNAKHVIDYSAAGPRAALIAGKLASALRGLLSEVDQWPNRGDDNSDRLWRDARLALDEWENFTRER